ncbi:hypothetical protein Mapa_017755 [Marchantia paleacea]|nr:hypothetical protein Mapa_017755 [Marchantia paleacea]
MRGIHECMTRQKSVSQWTARRGRYMLYGQTMPQNHYSKHFDNILPCFRTNIHISVYAEQNRV